jgi:hypothetical protein
MLGRGRGWHRGYRSWSQAPVGVLEGYTYIGPCRCGFGPDAYYQDKSGRVVHATQIFRKGIAPTLIKDDFEAELSQLRAEKTELEKRIKELEEHFKAKEGES